jgi:hypothetical protein
MRLLNTKTLALHVFFQIIPPYVILSHTWGDDEVTFDDIHHDHAKGMQGYSKIVKCCEQAIRDGYEWAWIDTCCIDKRSSSELNEAINSMYKWYWDSEICYAFLSDVRLHRSDGVDVWLENIRWFSRGWCLQELLAPAVVEFYDAGWVCIGTKSSAVANISTLTGIDEKYLLDRRSIGHSSIATRFSWVSSRHTARPEDIAYCLLGLVDVNMPLLYGEGDKAFYRLQLELIKKSNEHTIFAWNPYGLLGPGGRLGLLASHPRDFRDSSGIEVRNRDDISTFEVTNSGLRITLRAHNWENNVFVGILNCQDASGRIIGVNLKRASDSSFTGQCFRNPDTHLIVLMPEMMNEAQLDKVNLLITTRATQLPARVSHAPKNTRMRVAFQNNSPNKFRLQKIELHPEPWLKRMSHYQLLVNQDIIELPDGSSGGFLFSDDVSSYLVALGPQGKTMWSAVIPEVQSASASEALDNISREIMQGRDVGYLGDHRSHILSGPVPTKVTVRAKKRIVQKPTTPRRYVHQWSTIWDTTITFHSLDGPALPANDSAQITET